MEKEEILVKYKALEERLEKKGGREFQLKILRDCSKIIEDAFIPGLDGREKLMEKLNNFHSLYMEAIKDPTRQSKANSAICIVAACVAFFQEDTNGKNSNS